MPGTPSPPADRAPVPLILGASGRLGRYLAAAWRVAAPAPGVAPLWQWRGADRAPAGREHLLWDPLAAPLPRVQAGRVDAVLVLAGVVQGAPSALARNTDLALAGIAAARELGAAHVFLASSAAVYGAGPGTRSEAEAPAPVSAYGHAKLAMEHAVAERAARPGGPACTCLRIGNVAGADQLLGNAAAGPVALDRFADGGGPRRAYIGPATLAGVLARLVRLAAAGAVLPPLLNVASPGVVAMADLLAAAGAEWRWRPAPESALAEMALDTGRLAAWIPDLPAADPAAMVAEWRRLERAA